MNSDKTSQDADEEDVVGMGGALLAARAAAEGEEEDGDPFELLAEDKHPRGKVPLHKAKNLLKLRAMRTGILTGEVTLEEFEVTVEEIYHVANNALNLFQLPSVRKRETKLTPEQAQVYEDSRAYLSDLVTGIDRMLQYCQTEDRADLEEGMEKVENAMIGISKTQDAAIERRGDDAEAPEEPETPREAKLEDETY